MLIGFTGPKVDIGGPDVNGDVDVNLPSGSIDIDGPKGGINGDADIDIKGPKVMSNKIVQTE